MKILQQQFWHFLSLCILIFGLYWLANKEPLFLQGKLWGINTRLWLLFSICVPVIHQVYVLVCWRSELYYHGMTTLFGLKAFTIYKIGFAILIMLRPVSILLLAISNSSTLVLSTPISWLLSAILLIPAVYLFYSVKRYFGIDRAFGIDHFEPEKYKDAPMVHKGIFRYASNGMYRYGFLILWIPGILLKSEAAIVIAVFNHLYIWVHYYFTELPDMKVIYHSVKKR